MSVGGPAPFSGSIHSTIRIRYCSNVGPPTRLRMALAWRSQSLADIGRTAVISSSTLHVRRRSSSGSLEALTGLHSFPRWPDQALLRTAEWHPKIVVPDRQ